MDTEHDDEFINDATLGRLSVKRNKIFCLLENYINPNNFVGSCSFICHVNYILKVVINKIR